MKPPGRYAHPFQNCRRFLSAQRASGRVTPLQTEYRSRWPRASSVHDQAESQTAWRLPQTWQGKGRKRATVGISSSAGEVTIVSSISLSFHVGDHKCVLVVSEVKTLIRAHSPESVSGGNLTWDLISAKGSLRSELCPTQRRLSTTRASDISRSANPAAVPRKKLIILFTRRIRRCATGTYTSFPDLRPVPPFTAFIPAPAQTCHMLRLFNQILLVSPLAGLDEFEPRKQCHNGLGTEVIAREWSVRLRHTSYVVSLN